MDIYPPQWQAPKPEKPVIEWPLEVRYPGEMPIETDEGEGKPSRWNTLRALRVLHWYSGGNERPDFEHEHVE
jgi:hypothetical protein